MGPTTWLEFYQALKENELLEDHEIESIKASFELKGIKFDHLTKKGKFSMTASRLKERYSISKDHLQYAILSAIDSFHNKTTDLRLLDFYQALKDNKKLNESEVEKIKLAFETQKYQFETLMDMGDLAITDTDLVICGIQELGARKVILSFIFNITNQR